MLLAYVGERATPLFITFKMSAMNIAINAPRVPAKEFLYRIAEYAVALLVLTYGITHLKQIIAFVLMELYKYLIQQNMLPTLI